MPRRKHVRKEKGKEPAEASPAPSGAVTVESAEAAPAVYKEPMRLQELGARIAVTPWLPADSITFAIRGDTMVRCGAVAFGPRAANSGIPSAPLYTKENIALAIDEAWRSVQEDDARQRRQWYLEHHLRREPDVAWHKAIDKHKTTKREYVKRSIAAITEGSLQLAKAALQMTPLSNDGPAEYASSFTSYIVEQVVPRPAMETRARAAAAAKKEREKRQKAAAKMVQEAMARSPRRTLDPLPSPSSAMPKTAVEQEEERASSSSYTATSGESQHGRPPPPTPAGSVSGPPGTPPTLPGVTTATAVAEGSVVVPAPPLLPTRSDDFPGYEHEPSEGSKTWHVCCCGDVSRQLVTFTVQVFVLLGMCVFAIVKLSTLPSDDSSTKVYWGLLTMAVGVLIPNPRVKATLKAHIPTATRR